MGFWSWFRRKKRKDSLVGATEEDDEVYVQLMKEKMGLEYKCDWTFLKDMEAKRKMRRRCELMAEKRKKRGLKYIR